MIILHRKETRKAYQSSFPHVQTACSHAYHRNEWKRFWMKTNQENRLVSEKVDHLQTNNQLTEKNVIYLKDAFALDTLTMKRHLTP